MKWRGFEWTLAGLLLLASFSAQAEERLLELSVGIHRIQVEVANTQDLRTQGLMFRKKLPPNQGMLFVFERSAPYCMWMRNTLIPLSVAFLDEQGRILNVEEMHPQTEDLHCASRPAQFALEMSAAWFKERGLGSNSIVAGLDKAPLPH